MSRQQDPPQELVIAQENEASTPDVQEGVPSQNAELTGTLEHEMPAVPNPPECVLVQNLEVVSALKHDSYLSDVQEGVLILKLKPVFSTLEHVHSTSVVQQAVLVQQEPLQVLQSEPTFPIPITKARPNVNHARHCTGCLFITG